MSCTLRPASRCGPHPHPALWEDSSAGVNFTFTRMRGDMNMTLRFRDATVPTSPFQRGAEFSTISP